MTAEQEEIRNLKAQVKRLEMENDILKKAQTRYEAQQDILQYLSVFYNGYRLHSTLDYVSPNEYERQFNEMKKAA